MKLIILLPLTLAASYVVWKSMEHNSGASSQDSRIIQESKELAEASDLSETATRMLAEQNPNEGLPLATRALDIRQRLLPANDPQIELSIRLVGELYLLKKDYSKARLQYELMLQKRESRVGAEHRSLFPILERLAAIYLREEKFRQAEDAHLRSVALLENSIGPAKSELADALITLGQFYRARRDFKRGEVVYKRALSIYGELKGVESSDFERARKGFICLSFETDKLERLKDLSEIRKQFPLPQRTDVISIEEKPLNSLTTRMPKPEYPQDARVRGVNGVVIVKVLIDEKGHVVDAADFCQGSTYLTESTLYAARQARFEPTLLDGHPVKVTGFLAYKFAH